VYIVGNKLISDEHTVKLEGTISLLHIRENNIESSDQSIRAEGTITGLYIEGNNITAADVGISATSATLLDVFIQENIIDANVVGARYGILFFNSPSNRVQINNNHITSIQSSI